MSTHAFKIKSGNTRPSVRARLTDASGAAVNLTGAQIRFRMANLKGETVVDAAAAIEGDPLLGIVRYDWTAGDTATPGTYKAEWVVTFTGGVVQTYPRGEDYNKILIGASIAPITSP